MEDLEKFGEHPQVDYEIRGHIPKKMLKAFVVHDVEFTCIDAIDDVLVIGSNVGTVFFYQRKYKKIEKLIPERMFYKVTCVKVISSVDYVIAAGDEHGRVTIYIIKKNQWNNDNRKTSIERFTVDHIHLAPISAIEWSLNAEKLFTGDVKGVVVYTHIKYNFHANVINSLDILYENHRIVQLSYLQPQILLVSTSQRVLIYNQAKPIEDNVNSGVELKKRDGMFGAVLDKDFASKPVIYAALPRKCVWLGDVEGATLKQISFEGALSKEHRIIEFDDSNSSRKFQAPVFSEVTIPQFEFSSLKMYRKDHMLAYHRNALFLLNLKNSSIVAAFYFTHCPLVSVAVNANEVFLLQDNRRIRRLALDEDPYDGVRSINENIKESKSISELGDALLDKMSKIKTETVTKVKPLFNTFSVIENRISKMMEPVSPADDALITLASDSASDPQASGEESGNNEIQIIRISGKKPIEVKIRNMDDDSDNIISREIAGMNGTREKANGFTEAPLETEKDSTAQKQSTEILRKIIPNPQKTDAIEQNVKENEDQQNVVQDFISNAIANPSPALDIAQPSSSRAASNQFSATSPCSFEGMMSPLALMANNDKNLSKNPIWVPYNMGMNIEKVNESESESEQSSDLSPNEPVVENESSSPIENDDNWDDSWKPCNLICPARWICATNGGIFCGANKSNVYYAETRNVKLNWVKQNMKALRLLASPSGNIVWKIDLGVAYAYTRNLLDRWQFISRNVESIAVTDHSVWFVSEGDVYLHSELTGERPFSNESRNVGCPQKVQKICCFDDNVWVLTKNKEILSRDPLSIGKVNVILWEAVQVPDGVVVMDIALGCKNTGWIVSQNNEIFFSDNFHDTYSPNWWQMFIGIKDVKSSSILSSQLSNLMHWPSSKGTHSISSSDNAIWILRTDSTILQFNQNRIRGHRWIPYYEEQLDLPVNWKFVRALGSSINSTVLWCLSQSNDLFVFNPITRSYRPIEAPTTENIVCLTTAPGSAWVLTQSGITHCRTGINDKNPYGSIWVRASIIDKRNRKLQFKSMVLGNKSVWAVDIHNKVFIAEADPLLVDQEPTVMDWVDLSAPANCKKFLKIVVGPQYDTVWGIDDENQVYVRERISKSTVYGSSWMYVSGIHASHLAVSMTDVWAIALNGTLYRRFGITDDNYIGDYWVEVPGAMSSITATKNEGLWGVSKVDGKLMKYEKHIVNLLRESGERNRRISENIDGDWEFI